MREVFLDDRDNFFYRLNRPFHFVSCDDCWPGHWSFDGHRRSGGARSSGLTTVPTRSPWPRKRVGSRESITGSTFQASAVFPTGSRKNRFVEDTIQDCFIFECRTLRSSGRRQLIASQLFDRSVREFVRLKEIRILRRDCGGVWMSSRSVKENGQMGLFLLVTGAS